MSELEQAKADNVKLVEERERLVREVADASQHIQMLERRAADNSELASSMLASTWMSAGANALPQYDLEKREFPFSQFRVDFEIYCRGMGLSENSPTRKMLLHRALVGLALQRYKDTLQTGSITSYQAIMDDLEQYLTALEGGVKYSSTSFHKKQQGDSETVTAYYAGLMKLAKTSWPDPNNPAPEQVVLEQFIRGLRLPLKRIVLAKEPSTLKDALEHACKAQAQREFLLEDEPLVTAAAVANDSLAQQVNVLTKQVSNLVAFNAAQRPPLHNYRHTPPPPPSNGKNFWPEPRHHFPARRSGGGPKPGTAYNRKGDQRCWNCQGWGHFAATCRKPRKPVSDRQNQLGRAVPRPARGVVNTVSVDDSQVTQHTSAPSAGSGVSFGNGHIFLATICFMSMVSVCAAQRPMLCQTSVKGQLFRLPEIYDCQPDVSSAPTTPARVTIELARRNLLQYETKGWLCRGVKSSARLLRYFFGDETLKEFSESAIPVSIDQCREMVKGGVSPAGPLATSPTGMMETKNMLNWRVPRGGLPECCKWWEWKEDNYFVTPVSVYTHFGAKRFQCTGADVSECPGYAQGSCRLGDKALVWEVNHKVECEFLPYQNLSGNMAHKSWMSDNGQLALTTHFDRNVSDCEITWILSDQGIAFRHIDQARAKRESASNGDVGYVMTDMLASELQALHDTVVKEMHTVYRHSLQQACSSLKLTSELVRAFTIASPTVAVRQLLNRTDVVADSSHGILELWSCLEVRNVTFKTISSKEVSKGSCIREVPLVLHMNGAQYDGYLDTNTLVVKYTGTTIDCSERPWVTFQLFKRMYTYHRPTFTVKRISKKMGISLPFSHLTLKDDFSELVKPKVFSPVIMYTWQELQPVADLNALLHNTLVENEIIGNLKAVTHPANFSSSGDQFGIAEKIVQKGLTNIFTFLTEPIHLWIVVSCLALNSYFVVMICKRFTLFNKIANGARRLRAKNRNQKVVNVIVPDVTDPEIESFVSSEPIETIVRRVCEGNTVDSRESEMVNHLISMKRVLTIGVKIKGRTFSFLLDSGASVSLVTSRLIEQLKLKPVERKRDSDADVVSVTGHKLPLDCVVELNVGIGTKSRTHEFPVLRNCRLEVDGVLGLDILATLPPFSVDVKAKKVFIGNEQLPVSGADDLRVSACAVDTIKIAPRTAVVVPCRLSLPIKQGTELLFEQVSQPAGELLSPHTLVCADTTIPVRVANVSQHPVTVYANSKVGIVSLAAEVQQHNVQGTKGSDMYSRKVLQNLNLEDSNITWEEESQLQGLLSKYSVLFAIEDSDLPGTTACEHEIKLTDGRPIKQKPYRVPQSKRKEVEDKLEDLLRAGVISPSSSPWASPVVLVSKPDGSVRICIDYRKLNAVTVPDAYPLPRIDEAMEFLSGAQYLTTLDLFSGFHQVPVAEDSRKYTAFITSKGLFEWNRLPFGLRNSPATFQRLMSFVLSGLLFSSAIVYLDDVLIASKTFDEHVKHLEEVFQRLLQFGLRLKMKKCHWVRRSLPFLGFVISPDGAHPDPGNINKLANYTPPKNVSQVRTFLGFCNFYRRFVANYADIVRPLTSLTKKRNNFVWTKECELAFKTLIEKLTRAPILRYPQFDKVFLVSVDASKYACGGILSQMYGDREHPIAYFSRTFQKHEVRYETVEKELYAIVLALKHWRHYLYGHPVYVYSDQQSISWGIKQVNNARLMKWVSQLAEFDVKLFYRPGSKNRPADFFSRMNYTSVDLEDEKPVLATRSVLSALYSIAREPQQDFFRVEQRKDPVLRYVIERKLNSLPLSRVPEDLRSEVKRSETKCDYSRSDGCLRNFSESRGRLVVPKHLIAKILEECHDAVYGGHFKVDKTLGKVLERFYWPTVRQDVENWVKSCQGCLTRAHMTHPIKEPMQPIMAAAPWIAVVMDILGPLPVSNRGNKYILVIMDRFTKYPECAPLRSISAKVVAKSFVQLIVCRHGVPAKLQTDRGTQFTSQLFSEVSKLLGMRQAFSCAYHPESQGLVEKFNGTLLQLLKAYVDREQKDWCSYLDLVLLAYRTSKHASTGHTPFEMEHGRTCRLPVHLLCPSTDEPCFESSDEFMETLRQKLRGCWRVAHDNNEVASAAQKKQHDKRVRFVDIHPGDKVYVKRPSPKAGLSPKLQPLYKGPYEVLVRQGVDVLVQHGRTQRPDWVHLNDCKLAEERLQHWPEAVAHDSVPPVPSDATEPAPIKSPNESLGAEIGGNPSASNATQDLSDADSDNIVWDDEGGKADESADADEQPRYGLRPRTGPKPLYNVNKWF